MRHFWSITTWWFARDLIGLFALIAITASIAAHSAVAADSKSLPEFPNSVEHVAKLGEPEVVACEDAAWEDVGGPGTVKPFPQIFRCPIIVRDDEDEPLLSQRSQLHRPRLRSRLR